MRHQWIILHGGNNVTIRIHREGYETGYNCFCAETPLEIGPRKSHKGK